MLFIVAGLGGYSGSRAAPMISLIAREMDIVTVGVVTLPMDWETSVRFQLANNGLIELETNIDSLIVLSQEKLYESLANEDITYDKFSDYCVSRIKSAIRVIFDKTKECQSA